MEFGGAVSGSENHMLPVLRWHYFESGASVGVKNVYLRMCHGNSGDDDEHRCASSLAD